MTNEELRKMCETGSCADFVNRLLDRVADRDRLAAEVERLTTEVSEHRKGHSDLARGIKKALGLQNWPDFGDKSFHEGVANLVAAANKRVEELETVLKTIQQWDCLNPAEPEMLHDLPWLKRIVDEALAASTSTPEEWVTANERTVKWDKEQTEHLRQRLASTNPPASDKPETEGKT